MVKIFPILGVCFLLLGGLGAVALPTEKNILETPIDTDDWLLEIKIVGGFLGYKVTVENVGSEQVCGDLDISIKTNASFIILGERLKFAADDLTITPTEFYSYKMRPVIGFGPAPISATIEFRPKNEYFGYAVRTETEGYVYLFYVDCEEILNIIPW